MRDAEIGRRLADKLIQVHTNDGDSLIVLVHTEIQGQVDHSFDRRMFTYHYRILDRYNCAVVSLAVLGDTSEDWRPDSFRYSRWGCSLDFSFPSVKLIDWLQRWEELEKNTQKASSVSRCLFYGK